MIYVLTVEPNPQIRDRRLTYVGILVVYVGVVEFNRLSFPIYCDFIEHLTETELQIIILIVLA